MSNRTRALPGNTDHERRIHLERYVKAWLLDHAMTTDDLKIAEVRGRLVKSLLSDVGAVLGRGTDAIAAYIGARAMKGASEAIQKGVGKLLDWGKAR